MPTVEDLDGFELFHRLTAAQRVAVARTAEDSDYAAGSRLFDVGRDAVGCWLIRTGQVALETSVPGRGPVVVQTVGPGDVLGWSWLVPPSQWRISATASEPVSAIRFDTVMLRMLAEEDPALGYPLVLGLFEAMLARLESTRARLLDLYGSPRERA